MWLHGGGYQVGTGPDMTDEGVTFARDHGMVTVSFNYRLGALGFLAMPGDPQTGAFGLHDQIAALHWVRDNIAGFGGDPEQITIYGVSAGAKSVATLRASPIARGTFARAASSSGGADHVSTPAYDAALARLFLAALGTSADRARSAPARDVLAAQRAVADGIRATWVWRPSVDGRALTDSPINAITAGSAAGIPLLAQTCVDEGAGYQFAAPDAGAQADRVLTEYFGEQEAGELLSLYTGLAGPEQGRLDVLTDERYRIPTIRMAEAQSRHATVWCSRFDGPPGLDLPAVHGSDGLGVWQGGPGVNGRMHEAWAAFVQSGTPFVEGDDWRPYDTKRRTTFVFAADGDRVESDPDQQRRIAWEGRSWAAGTWWPRAGLVTGE